MGEHSLVLITCGDRDEATLIARSLVEGSLAAGVQMVPIRSIYVWDGDVVEDSEWLLIAKTRADRFESIATRVEENHSYQVPPVLMIDIEAATRPYLAWIDESIGPPN
ncbi:MAG TPA: divalent-cation tolerance protein CutA [Acidimicrobiia bacterium]|nr:divalent-cation tolerance protein CutA [Acidimicrobiia bacterium]